MTRSKSLLELDLLTEVNAHVHEAARRFEGVEPGPDRWEFRCECGATDCRETVSLTLADYEAQRAGGQPVLAPGHATIGAADLRPGE